MSLWRYLWWTRAYFNVRRNFKREKISTQHDVENKQEENEKLKKEDNEKLRKRNENENEQLRKNNVVKDTEIEESIKKKQWR